MALTFHKFHGAGNDFIIFDDREGLFSNQVKNQREFINRVCNRNFGIGADGLMLLKNSDIADFQMVYFNSDGREGSLCGNGGRCIVAFAQTLGMLSNQTTFLATDGLHLATINSFERNLWDISLKMNDVETVSGYNNEYFVHTGSPHLVIFSGDISEKDVFTLGRAIRYSGAYASNGVNVNFAQVLTADTIKMRTYERGVENETLACGTGATAVAISAWASGVCNPGNVYVLNAPGGQLRVNFLPPENQQGIFREVWLSGPAQKVFEGNIQLNE